MSVSSSNQPEPFDPATMPPPTPARQRPARPILPILGALVLAAVAFGGGFAVANAVAPKATIQPGGDGQGFNGQGFPNASGRPRNGFGGGASGTVGSVGADQLTITTQAGGSRLVLLTSTTAVTQVTAAQKALSDLAAGQTVTVVGSTNPDGSVTATRIIIGDVGALGLGGGFGGGGPAPSATP